VLAGHAGAAAAQEGQGRPARSAVRAARRALVRVSGECTASTSHSHTHSLTHTTHHCIQFPDAPYLSLSSQCMCSRNHLSLQSSRL
jgi:hypothetical protein